MGDDARDASDARASASRDDANDANDANDAIDANDEDFMALIRRAKAIANVAEAEKRDAERLRRAEQRWGQAITRDGRRYYFDKIERGTVQWECPRELKGTRTRTLRADVVESPTLPDGWRELRSETAEKIPYYWNMHTGLVQWERPRNEALAVAVVVPARAAGAASR